MNKVTAALSYEQLDAYNRDGFLVLRNVFTPEEVAIFQAECDRFLALEDHLDPRNLRVGFRKLDDGEQIIERFDPVHDISAVFTDLVYDERILAPLRDIYLDEPKIFKDKLIFKLPGVSGYTMHQDAAYWQGFNYEGLISAMVAIDGADKENGGLELFPGYHDHLRSTPGVQMQMPPEEIAKLDVDKGIIVETNPGDLILFHSLTPHQSGKNTANRSRRQLYLTYSPAKDGDLYRAHYQHYHRYNLRSKGVTVEQDHEYYFK